MTDDIRLSNGFIGEVFDRLSELGIVGMVHAEDYSVCQQRSDAVRATPAAESPTSYPRTRPAYAEAMAVDAAVRLALAADAKDYGVHTTSEAAADRKHSRADYSVYEGRELTGRVKRTFVRGEDVYTDGRIVASPGHSEFLARDVPDWDEGAG
ncbi:amidohydrolase family protein [Natrinema versiforme]|uniref:D-hydantoinase n=1 Tax=Natrinema versiforme JCM 10478 TaxID=1227496 RepID=L9XNJ3_9EURY|nr:hypothetical protein [Natrinema versiforme]ELY63320.1 D-hydantoinase [Natrinema versiforme JCM 10478]